MADLTRIQKVGITLDQDDILEFIKWKYPALEEELQTVKDIKVYATSSSVVRHINTGHGDRQITVEGAEIRLSWCING